MKTHSFDTISFVSGLVATTIGLIYLIPKEPGDLFDLFGEAGRYFWPALFVILGLAVIAPIFLGRTGGDVDPEEDQAD